MMAGAGGQLLQPPARPAPRARARRPGPVPDAAEAGEAWAARDVSMPGVAGSLLQLCESAGGLGCALDLDALPVPPGLTLDRWLLTFPSYGFLLVGDPGPLGARFAAAGLTLAHGRDARRLGGAAPRAGGEEEPVWDLGEHDLTGLRPSAT